jgi:hypothetical protein
VIPSLLGVLARQFSLEVIPVCLLVVFAALLGVYILGVVSRKPQAASVSLARENKSAVDPE